MGCRSSADRLGQGEPRGDLQVRHAFAKAGFRQGGCYKAASTQASVLLPSPPRRQPRDVRQPRRRGERGAAFSRTRTTAAASLGLVCLWDDAQLSVLDTFLVAESEWVRKGGSSLWHCSQTLRAGTTDTHSMRLAALTGLGLAYSGSQREDVAELMLLYALDHGASATAGLVLGHVFAGSAHEVYASQAGSHVSNADSTASSVCLNCNRTLYTRTGVSSQSHAHTTAPFAVQCSG